MGFKEKSLDELTNELDFYSFIYREIFLDYPHEIDLNDINSNIVKQLGEQISEESVIIASNFYRHITSSTKFNQVNLPTLIGDALTNAFIYGKIRNIKVETKFGFNGHLFIIPQGQGFNYQEIIERFNRKEKYAERNGGGFKRFSETEVEIWYHDQGRLLSITLRK